MAELVPSRILFRRCGIVSSTMDVARELIRDGKVSMPFGVLAESQTAGRGHNERSWLSEKGNLFLTLAIPQQYLTPVGSANSSFGMMLPLLTVLAVRRACMSMLKSRGYFFTPEEQLEPVPDLRDGVRVKWINDLIFDKRKLGGILVEADGERQAYLVGIGINLCTAPTVQDGGRATSYLTEVAKCARGRVGVAGTDDGSDERWEPDQLAEMIWEEMGHDLRRSVESVNNSKEQYLRQIIVNEMKHAMDWSLTYTKRDDPTKEMFQAVSLDSNWGSLVVKRKDGTGEPETWLCPAD